MLIKKSSSRIFRKIAAILILAIVYPTSLGFLTSGVAQAQTRIMRVIVLDFQVKKGMSSLLGRKAADALANELTASGEYEVIPESRSSRKSPLKAMLASFGRSANQDCQQHGA